MDTAYGEEGTTCGVAITLVQHRTTLLGTVQFGPRCFLPNELIDILGLDAFVLPVRGTWGSFGRLNLVFDPDRAAGEGLDFGCDLTLEGVGYDADEDDLVDYLTGEFTAEFFFEGVPDLGDVRIRPGGTFEAERAAD
ncbi:MAG TPA: hypothetical protein ENN80_02485 [Candidatus Hydrogenedentes bacterium]|nr:hypothetical protein [Candidatus Hydrogenedentota bacterium]